MQTLDPTQGQRFNTLDLIRGAAILGILLANIPFFAGPHMGHLMEVVPEQESMSDKIVDAFRMAFVTGKFRSMLAVLFGVGMFLQFIKLEASGKWPGRYLRRTTWLLLIGLVHAILIWFGDILFQYSLYAFLACFFVKLGDSTKLLIAKILSAIAALSILQVVASFFTDGKQPMMEFLSTYINSSIESQAFGSGTYYDQLILRLKVFPLFLVSSAFMVFHLLPLFLIGQVLANRRILERPSQHPGAIRKLIKFGLYVGLPLNLLAFVTIFMGDQRGASQNFEMFIGPALAPAYLAWLALAAERGTLGRFGRALEKVGRVALSCYLLQSVLCSIIFYSWGFGMFGGLDNLQQLPIVVLVWAIDIAFAVLWLRKFQIGPVEWVWRSLSEGRRLPLRRSTSAAPVTVGAG